jgi:hypothetical protein
MEVDLLHSHAVVTRRLDFADVVDQGGKLALVKGKNTVLNIERFIPAYVQTTLATGILISGKMSTGMRSAAPTPRLQRRINPAITV